MTVTFQDSISGSDNFVDLNTHTPDIVGGAWTALVGKAVINTNLFVQSNVTTGGYQIYVTNSPSGAGNTALDMQWTHNFGASLSNTPVGMWFYGDSGGVNSYLVAGRNASGTGLITLYKMLSGPTSPTFTALVNGNYVFTTNTSVYIKCTVRVSGSNLVFVIYAGGTQVATYTDSSPLSYNQYCGYFCNGLAGITNGPQVREMIVQTNTSATNGNNIFIYPTATAGQLWGPSSGNELVASSPFTLYIVGQIASNVAFTLSDGGAGGTFSVNPITLSTNGSVSPVAQTFTYTPNTTGNITITTTNNGGLSNPSIVYQSAAVGFVVPVTSAGFRFSPGNWYGNSGRGGSTYRKTLWPGAYFYFQWNASNIPTLSLNIPTNTSTLGLCVFLNGGQIDVNVSANSNLQITGITASAVNSILVMLTYSNQGVGSRWNGGSQQLEITGITLDGNSSAATAPATLGWWLFYGDSITEGVGTSNTLTCWSGLIGMMLLNQNYDFCIKPCGGQGFNQTGVGGVPALYYTSGGTYNASLSSWNLIDEGISLLDSNNQISAYGLTGTTPIGIFVNEGTNDSIYATGTTNTQNSVQQFTTALRGAAPTSYIIICVPFGLYNTAEFSTGLSYIAAIEEGYTLSAGYRTSLANYGTQLSLNLYSSGVSNISSADNIHPTAAGDAIIVPNVAYTMALVTAVVASSQSGPCGFGLKAGGRL